MATQPGPTVGAALLLGIVEALLESGLELPLIEVKTGITLSQLTDPDEQVPMEWLVQLERQIPELLGNPAAALHLGSGCMGNGGKSGLVGHIAANSATIREGVEQAIQYQNLLGESTQLALRVQDALAEFVYTRSDPLYITRQGIELVLSSTMMVLKASVGGNFRVLSAHFQYPAPDYVDAYRALFGIRLVFEAAENKLVFPASALALPSPYAQSYVQTILIRHAADLLDRLDTSKTFTRELHEKIISRLAWGELNIDSIAAELGMSRQTLYRRLKDEGTTFRELVDNIRKNLAASYLSNRVHSITEVAFLLGFADSTAFHRAFRRWYKTSPKAFDVNSPCD